MKLNWPASTAIALVIGTGAVIAQAQPDQQKREEAPRAQAPSPSPKAGEQPADRKGRAEPQAGAKEPRRESAPERKQAQEPSPPPARAGTEPSAAQQGRDGAPEPKQQQSQDRQKGRDGSPEPKQQQSQERQKDRDGSQAEPKQSQDRQKGRDGSSEPKQQQSQERRKGRDGAPEAKQQQSQDRQKDRDGSQAEPKQQQSQDQQPPASTRQGARPDDRRRGETAGQPSDRSGASRETSVSERQREEIVERLRRERTDRNRDINIEVTIGQRLPPRVRPRALPPAIVRIAPQYRGYRYVFVEDEIVIVHPRTREVVEVIREPGARRTTRETRETVVITREQRDTIRQAARRLVSAPTSTGSPSSGTLSDSTCLTLRPLPEDLARNDAELRDLRMLVIGEQIVLIDPRDKKVVEVID